MVWNHADRLKLLGIIEHRPWHWNKLDFYYTDNDYKENDFKEIAELMGKSVDDCQRNWRSMKVCYYRMLRNKKTGKSERTKELTKRSSFLKESFQLITTRPKRRANSKADKQNEKLSKSKGVCEQNSEYVDFKIDDLSVCNQLLNHPVINSENKISKEAISNKDLNITNTKELGLNAFKYRKSDKLTMDQKIIKCPDLITNQNSDIVDFEIFGQLITKRLRKMDMNIAHDTMHHIHNIIYEQQQNSKICDLLD